MSAAKEAELSLKVFINKEKTKVLFAEAGNDFADVLLSFLMLPLGRIVKVMEKHFGENAPTIGSLTTLYNGFITKPEILSKFDFSNLKVRVDDSHPNTNDFGKPYSGVFTINSASFLISDDLRMVPNLTGSILLTLEKLGIDVMDMEGAEMMNVTFGFKEILDLLKASFASHTPLSDLILGKKQIVFKAEVEDGISFHQYNEAAMCCRWKMILKVTFQKSKKKFLFAQADRVFKQYLSNLLLIPLGSIEWLLLSNTRLNNIDNLYKSIADDIGAWYLKGTDSKEQLLNPGVCKLYNSDDLTVKRLRMSSALSLLNEMKVSLSDVEEVEFRVGKKECLSILKASLTSTRVLTDGLINPKLKEQPTPEV